MNKGELIEALAAKSELSKAAAGRTLDALIAINSYEHAQGWCNRSTTNSKNEKFAFT